MSKITRIRKKTDINRDMISRFCEFLGDERLQCITTFTDKKGAYKSAKDDPNNKVWRCVSQSALNWVQASTEDGAGTYVTINRLSKDERGNQVARSLNANVVEIRFLFLDYDRKDNPNDPIERVLKELKPAAIVRSSLGNWHAYIRVSGVPLELFGVLQEALAEKYGTDTTITNLARIMRLPGTINQKNPDDPYPVTFYEPEDGYDWDYEEFILEQELEDVVNDYLCVKNACDGDVESQSREEFSEEQVQSIVDGAVQALKDGSLGEGRQPWLHLGMALHWWNDDPDGPGYDAWRRFSLEAYPGLYDDEEGENDRQKRWDSFGKSDGDAQLTLASYSQFVDPTSSAQQDFAEFKGEVVENSRSRTRKSLSIMDEISQMRVTDEQVEKSKNFKQILPGLMGESTLTLIAAPPESGKTGIMFEIFNRPELYEQGYRTYYIHIDIMYSAIYLGHRYQERSDGHFIYCVPTISDDPHTGKDVMKLFTELSQSDEDLSKVIFVLDSLADFETDVTKDTAVKKFMNILKDLNSKGATIIVLAHTVKYVDPMTGMFVYKGSQVLAASVDYVLTLVPLKRKEDVEYDMSEIMLEEKAYREKKNNLPLDFEGKIVSFSEMTLKNRGGMNTQQSWIVAYGLATPLAIYVKPESRNKQIARDEEVEQDFEPDELAQLYMALRHYVKTHGRGPNYADMKSFRLALGVGHNAIVELIKDGRDLGYWDVTKVEGGKYNEKVYVPTDNWIVVGGKLTQVEDNDD